jgi:hypothetical protein
VARALSVRRDVQPVAPAARARDGAVQRSTIARGLDDLDHAWLWLAGLVLGAWLFGFHITFFAYPLIFGYVYGANLRSSLYISVSAVAVLWLIFDHFVGAVWPQPLLLPFLY